MRYDYFYNNYLFRGKFIVLHRQIVHTKFATLVLLLADTVDVVFT